MKKIRIGLVGVGFISDFHYNGFSKNENIEIAGGTRDFYGGEDNIKKQKEGLEIKCKNWNIKAYDNFDEIAADPDIDALVIMSINSCHYGQILKALDNGKHVLVEKPVITDFLQLDKIEEAAKNKNLVVFPGHNFIYREAVARARDIIKSGKLGAISYSSFVTTQVLSERHALGWRGKKSLASGGALMDSGHHLVYMSLYLMGMPSKIHSFKSKIFFKDMECEDIAQVNLLYPDDSIGCIMQSWASKWGKGLNGIRIIGDKGQVCITDALYFNSEKISSDVAYDNSFCNQAKAFADCIINGQKPVSSLDDVRNTLKLIYGAYESNENGRVVEF